MKGQTAALLAGGLALGAVAIAAARRPPGLDLGPSVTLTLDQTGQTSFLLDLSANGPGVFTWALISGPAGAPLPTITNLPTMEALMEFYAPGKYVIEGTMTLPSGQQMKGRVDVTVEPFAPPPAMLLSITVTPANATLEVGSPAVQYTATGHFDDNVDRPLNSYPGIEWGSSSPSVATVAPDGLVTPRAAGATTISARVGAPLGSANLTVTTVPVPPTLVALEITPPSLSLAFQEQATVQATAVYSDGSRQDVTTLAFWESVELDVARVNVIEQFGGAASVVVAWAGAGFTNIRATFQGVVGLMPVTCGAAPPAIPVITGFQPDGFTVPAGEVWELGQVVTPKSAIVLGTLVARPGSSIIFDYPGTEADFVGGDVPNPATDIGLLVDGGALDFEGTPKRAWDYGLISDPSWLPGDELIEAPLFPSEITSTGFRPYAAGSPLRTMPDGRQLPVFNLTRDVKISGMPGKRAHIWVNSPLPQIIRNVEISHMAPMRLDGSGNNVGVLGRYGLHFHKCGEGSRGSIVEGVVIKHAGNSAFITHESHGVDHRDNIEYDCQNTPFSWDAKTITNDLLYDRCVAAWVKVTPAFRGFRLSAFELQSGFGNMSRGCLAVGVQGNSSASGATWPEGASQIIGGIDLGGVWGFENFTALACKIDGIFTWQNSVPPGHEVPTLGKFVSINCGKAGVEHGAYLNDYQYHDLEIHSLPGGIGTIHHALPLEAPLRPPLGPRLDGYNQAWERVLVRGGLHAAMMVTHTLPSDMPILLKNYDVADVTGAKVVVNSSGAVPGQYDLVDWNPPLTPADVEIRAAVPGMILRIQQGAEAWSIDHLGVVTPIAPFYFG